MTISTDLASNKYIGKTNKFSETGFLLYGDDPVNFSNDIISALQSLGAYNVSFSNISNWISGVSPSVLSWRSNVDNQSSFARFQFSLATNGISARVNQNYSSNLSFESSETGLSIPMSSWRGLAVISPNADSISIVQYDFDDINNQGKFHFAYLGKLININDNYNYFYDSISQTYYHDVCVAISGTGTGNIEHKIYNCYRQNRGISNFLETGKGIYEIKCLNSDLPEEPVDFWGTDWHIFDTSIETGNARIGKINNLLLATGDSFIVGNLYEITSPLTEGGSDFWLAVGKFGDVAQRTILMRTFSN
jgi:hypothetical protein